MASAGNSIDVIAGAYMYAACTRKVAAASIYAELSEFEPVLYFHDGACLFR